MGEGRWVSGLGGEKGVRELWGARSVIGVKVEDVWEIVLIFRESVGEGIGIGICLVAVAAMVSPSSSARPGERCWIIDFRGVNRRRRFRLRRNKKTATTRRMRKAELLPIAMARVGPRERMGRD